MLITNKPNTVFTKELNLGTEPISVEPYRSEEWFELERERIFKRAWLNVAHASDVSEPGDYIVKRVEVCKANVLIVRGRDGVIRAFHDVCTHRGSKISPPGADRGHVNRLTCRYHAWTFDLEGKLLRATDEKQFFCLKKEELGLLNIHCEIWEGYIFLNFQREPDVSLKEYLGEFADHYAGLQALPGFPMNPASQSIQVQSVWKCNWKLAIGAFIEAYHIRVLHPKSIGNQYASSVNPFGHPEGIARWGLHSAIGLYGNPDYLADAIKDPVEAKFNPRGYHTPRPREEMLSAGLSHQAINLSQSGKWAHDEYLLFPNTLLYCRSYGSTTIRWWPLSANTMMWEATLYFTKANTIRQRMAQEFAAGRQREIVLEDVINLESQQNALDSSPLQHFQLNDEEVMLRLLDANVRRTIKADSISELCR